MKVRQPRKTLTSSFRCINILLFLTSLPVLLFLAKSWKPKEKVLYLNSACSACLQEPPSIIIPDINEHDAILSVDLLNNWHWCPSALVRMRALDAPVNEFLAKARRKGALIIHAVSDNKPHYLNEKGVSRAARTIPSHRVPDGPGREWGSITKFLLRTYDPPPPSSLSLDRTCGDFGRHLFGVNKPTGMPGLNESNIDVNYDIVAIDQDVMYSAIIDHKHKIRRILYVGVHLDLCILYSRWFSILRAAKFWGFGNEMEFGIVQTLVDMSNTNPKEEYLLQMNRDPVAVENLACWISCTAAPKFLESKDRIKIYDFR